MVCPLYRDCPLLRDSNCIILIGGLKFGDLVLSIIERYLIQCPLFGVSVKRDSTVDIYIYGDKHTSTREACFTRQSVLTSLIYSVSPFTGSIDSSDLLSMPEAVA